MPTFERKVALRAVCWRSPLLRRSGRADYEFRPPWRGGRQARQRFTKTADLQTLGDQAEPSGLSQLARKRLCPLQVYPLPGQHHGCVSRSRSRARTRRTWRSETPSSRAMARVDFCGSAARAAMIWCSARRSTAGGRPSLTPFVRARARPACMRSWMIERSNSANTPSI